MPKFVDMPHGFSFDIEELLYYRVSYGDTWMEQKENVPYFQQNMTKECGKPINQ